MSTVISNPESDFLLSAQIPDILVYSSDDAVDVCISVAGVELLSETYYTYNGKFEIYNIRSVIEQAMIANNHAFAEVRIDAVSESSNDSKSFNVLFCERNIFGEPDINRWLKENFLSAASIKRISKGSCDRLSFFANKGEDIAATFFLNYLDENDVPQYYSFTVNEGSNAENDAVNKIDIDTEYLQSLLEENVCKDYNIQSVTVNVSDRSFTYFIIDEDATLRFAFRNVFGVMEMIHLWGETTTKTTTEQSLAVLYSRSSFYDRTVEQSFESQVNNLTSSEVQLLSWFAASPHTVMLSGDKNDMDTAVDILITDYTCEMNDSDDELNDFKFTWRYADNRPVMNLSESVGIFDNTFSLPYV